MGLLSRFKRNDPSDILWGIHKERGVLWESIEQFRQDISKIDGVVLHHTQEMEEAFPLKHHLKDGLYTRTIFMPKGSLVVSFIHKTNHPSFFMKGEMSVLVDDGDVKRIKAPMVIHTEVGTQRVAYMHEDCEWTCVYKTDALTVEEAEKEVYTDDYRELPDSVIAKRLEKWLEYQQD